MSANRFSLIGGLLVAVGLFASGLYLRALRTELAAARHAAQVAQQQNRQREATIGALLAQMKHHEQALATLQRERARLHATYSNRATMIRQLQRHDPTLRPWADQPLPAAVIRLREHRAFVGAAAYYPRLPARESLHPTRNGPADERAAESRVGGDRSGVGRMRSPDRYDRRVSTQHAD